MKALVAYAEIPRSTFYHIAKKFDLPDPDADLKADIQAIYDEHEGRYGYRRIRDELANRGQKGESQEGATPHERAWLKMFSAYEKNINPIKVEWAKLRTIF